MKKIAIILAMATTTISFQANALEAIAATYISASLGASTVGGMTSSGKECQVVVCKRSEQIVLDAQDYYATGKMSEFLATEVQELKIGAGNISDDEAVDILVDFAQRTLILY